MNQLSQTKRWIESLKNQTWKEWIQWAIIFGVLAVSVMIPMVGSLENLQRVLLLIAVLIGFVILLQWPAIGLIGILIGNYFISYSGPGGVNAIVLGVTAVSALWIANMVIRKRTKYFFELRITRAILVFFASAILSFIIGQLSWQPLAQHAPLVAQAGGLAIFVLSGLAFLIQGNMIDDLRWLKAFTWIFVSIGVLYVAARLVPEVANILRHFFAAGAFTGSLFFVWILAIPFSQAMVNRQLKTIWRVALFALTLGVLYISIIQASSWKSGYIPPLAGLAVIIILILRRRAIPLMPLLLIGTWLVMKEAIASDQYSVLTRIEAWKIVFLLSSVSPIFGMGFGNYYWYTPLTTINGWRVSFSSHSQYVDIFSQTGLVGLVCFFWVMWEIARIGWKLLDSAPEGFARAYVYGALGGLAGTLVAGLFADWVLPFVYNIGMSGIRSSILSWFFLGGLVVIHRLVDKNRGIRISESPVGGNYE